MSVGQDPQLFWRLTLREIKTIMDGSAQRLTREHNDRAWSSWHTAMLSRVKRFPKLKELTIGGAEPRRQTIEEQIHIARQWTAALQRKS